MMKKSRVVTIATAGNEEPLMEPAVQFLLVLVQGIKAAMEADFAEIIWRQRFRSSLSHYCPIHVPEEFCVLHKTSRSSPGRESRVQAMHP